MVEVQKIRTLPMVVYISLNYHLILAAPELEYHNEFIKT